MFWAAKEKETVTPIPRPEFTEESLIRFWHFFDQNGKVKPEYAGWWATQLIAHRYKFKNSAQLCKAIRSIGTPLECDGRYITIKNVGSEYYRTLTEVGRGYPHDIPKYIIQDCLQFFRSHGVAKDSRGFAAFVEYYIPNEVPTT